MRHLTHGPDHPTPDEWHRLVDHVDLAADTVDTACKVSLEREKEIRQAFQAELDRLKAEHATKSAKVKAEKAAPGSIEEENSVGAAWWLLAGAAKVAPERCAEAGRDTRGKRVAKPARNPRVGPRRKRA